ncbi:MAG: hypothetical protein JWQ40_1387 [Segetibacter sp.]|nr:hypothetical protein [Segetibacter sp.]
MKNVLLLLLVLGINSTTYCNDTARVKPLHQPKMHLFSLADVRLHDGEFKHIMDLTHTYLLSLDPDRMASWFRREAGLSPKAAPYPFWESEDVWGKGPLAGHIMGFYLSSMSMMYQSTGDSAIINKLNYTLNELKAAQDAQGDGYLLAVINGRQVFKDVVAGKFTTSNPLINDSWEPVYIMNKVMLGLYSVYTRCNLPLAKDIFIKMADWFGDSVVNKLSHEQLQKLLVCEHGSINENYINAYQLTQDKKYLEWSKRLNDEDMWVPMAQGKDILNGWHANTQIPKFTGFQNVYDYTGEQKYTDAARFFWKTVVSKHTWANGGNSTGEHFFPVTEFENRVTWPGGAESCNSVNMLRLTEILYRDYAEPEKVDYYERVLYNHILANHDPERAMTVYFTSMRPGHYKVYGTEDKSFWCCTGTGFENPAKFGQMIYAHDDNSLYVNLFIPSQVSWKEKNITLTQTTHFPDEATAAFTVTVPQPVSYSLKIRHPYWVNAPSLMVRVNGKLYKTKSVAGGYAEINRIWKTGDKVTIELPGKIAVTPLVASNKFVSVTYGPLLLAAKVDNHGLTKEDFFSERQTVAVKEIPLSVVASFTGDSTTMVAGIIKDKGRGLSFTTTSAVTRWPVTLVPFHRIHYNRYALYFRHHNNEAANNREKQRKQREDTLRQAVIAATTDAVVPGNIESEQQHRLEVVNSSTGIMGNQKWRNAINGGYFMYRAKVSPREKQRLYLLMYKNTRGTKMFDVLVDGKLLKTISTTQLNEGGNEEFYTDIIDLPAALIGGNADVTIKFKARDKNATAGLLDLRILSGMKDFK